MANAPVIVIEDNPSNFLEYRLRGRPSVISFEELNLGHSSLRKIAPYALKIRQTALIPTQQFFSYAAVVATIDETSLACIIFDLVNADEIIAYAGHFVTRKNFLFDPVSREPVISDFTLLDSKPYHSHLTLFASANPNLVQFQDYFLHMCEPYQELVTKSQDMLMSTLQQQNNVVSMPNESNQVIHLLREPLTTSIYHETALPISNKSVERITQKIQPIGSVKVVYGELGSFHSHSYCQPKAIEDATNFNAVDETDGRTTYYSAYEEPGLMPFYYTSYLLGSLRDRHVVGVIEEDNFFIMATKRVYKRNSPAVPISPESLGSEFILKIHLPSTLSLSQVVTMLELRQILRHPFMFPDEIEAITKSFGFNEINKMPAIPSSTFSHQIGPKSMIERIRKTWLIDMLDAHYTQLFQNSVCEYGETPIDSNNPSLFCLDIARLWIKELLMFIHKDKPPKDDRKLSNFFRMTIAEFVQSYLDNFGLSPEFAITCHHLGRDGIPSSVCQMSVSAKGIGKHVQMYHTTPLLVCDHFRPFSLSFTSKFVSLTNQTDVSPLQMFYDDLPCYNNLNKRRMNNQKHPEDQPKKPRTSYMLPSMEQKDAVLEKPSGFEVKNEMAPKTLTSPTLATSSSQLLFKAGKKTEPLKPPMSAVAYYAMTHHFKWENLTPAEIGALWIMVPEKEKKKCIEEHEKKHKDYVREFEEFIRTLNPAELRSYRTVMENRARGQEDGDQNSKSISASLKSSEGSSDLPSKESAASADAKFAKSPSKIKPYSQHTNTRQIKANGLDLNFTAKAQINGTNQWVKIRGILDNGSTNSLITSALADKLRAEVIGRQNLRLITFGCPEPIAELLDIVRIKIAGHTKSITEKCIVSDKVQSIFPKPYVKTELTSILLAEGKIMADDRHEIPYHGENIDILIGNNMMSEILSLEAPRKLQKVLAQNTIFGWTISGRRSNQQVKEKDEVKESSDEKT